jgi:type I restriction enzyme M protein
MIIQEILKNSNYQLDLFTDAEIAELEQRVQSKETNGKLAFYIRCLVRDKDIRLKPEEIVRQLYLRRLMNTYGYQKHRIAVEFPVSMGSDKKFADIVILDKDHPTSAYTIVELKKPKWKEGKD